MAYQGEYDGLCGMYAIANAFMECGAEDGEEIFEAACSALARKRWPKVLWKGTTFGDMKRMIRACVRQKHTNNIKTRFPFWKNEPINDKRYWEKFDELLGNDSKTCGIVCVKFPNSPILHWIVAKKDGGRILFIDSDAKQPRIRKNRKSLYAGFRRRSPNQWLLFRRLLIVFEGT